MFKIKTAVRGFVFLFIVFSLACQINFPTVAQQNRPFPSIAAEKTKLAESDSLEIRKMLESAYRQIEITKNYDPAYVRIAYPNGDVPMEKGVCTDVVIRSFRNAGVDLQKEVHEDMRRNFAVYPKKWNLKSPDTNIDHRRVPNLQTYFSRRGKSLPPAPNGENYKPGDIVSWDLDGRGLTHIGLVSNVWNEPTKRYSIIHNIGGGTVLEDKIFDWKITGHYRFF